ncbi:hypothetical protein ACFY2R_30260, partial [Micromonospora olivasterospora]|uniref:hypothetical protein n=1 Tax=Micromonospora olivasterospora TaxID=1880 RepID=UPI0036A92CAE
MGNAALATSIVCSGTCANGRDRIDIGKTILRPGEGKSRPATRSFRTDKPTHRIHNGMSRIQQQG